MKKNRNTSQFINTADIMDAMERTLQMAQRIMRAIRKTVRKAKLELVTLGDYAQHYNITLEEAMILFKRVKA
jgi:hypothetical protein